MKKIFLLPYFGEYPPWLDQWVANMEHLDYDYKIFSNKKLFENRVREILNIEPYIIGGTGKVWDYRQALGVLYADEIKGYDCWGHTDFDCVYGDVDKYMPKEWDIWANHVDYICGPWTLYKNTDKINNLFRLYDGWKDKMENPRITGWGEYEYTTVANANCNVAYTFYQTKSQDDFSQLRYENGKLYDGEDEVMMAHFRHVKVYPLDRYSV